VKDNLDQYESPLHGATVQLHEIYMELRRSGFTRKEALYLVSQLLVNSLVSGKDDDIV
jgi:hypothetical protein